MTRDMARGRTLLLQLLFGSIIAAGATAPGQAAAAPAAKATEFDVVSIKPNSSGQLSRIGQVWKNEYTAKSAPLSVIILQAYLGQVSSSVPSFPSDERLKGAPSWVMTEPYDIVAKADDATANSWKDLGVSQKISMAAPMLRAMLEDRCKLAVHTVSTEVQGYALVVGKHGIKMKEAQPGEPVPARAVKMGGDWMMVPPLLGPGAKHSVTYLKITMTDFTAILNTGAVPIVDQTGLKGKYDFELPMIDISPPEGGEGAGPHPRPDLANMFNWGAIGLELRPAKVPTLNVVVDHIERPTAN